MSRATDGRLAVADALDAGSRAPPGRQPLIVLQPVSHPELGAIEIHDNLFAIGRTEAPFDAYAPGIVADLSRRHARIFCERGAVYLADLGSKNGTTVNGAPIRHAITALKSGDQLGLGGALSYRVQVEQGAQAPPHSAKLASLTLAPEQPGLGLQPIVVTEFPFMVSKADEAFARYRQASPDQVNYLSRRHAHIFLRGGQPFVEDLGSTNGTFVDGARLDEHAVALRDGARLAFGGHHFVYRVGLQWDAQRHDPTLTRLGVAGPGALASASASASAPAAASAPAPAVAAAAAPAATAAPVAETDKTTFVGAADSFLDIFCVDQANAADAVPDPAADAEAGPALTDGATRPRGAVAALMFELLAALRGKRAPNVRALRWGAGVLLLVAVAGWSLYRVGAPERDADALLSEGAYAQAAVVAGEGLARDPGNTRLQAIGTAATLKADLPAWMALVKARQYKQAMTVVAAMRQQAHGNPELEPLLAELEWIVRLEAFVAARGGAQAPIANPADRSRIAQILKQWEDQNEAHQRAFVTMSSYVPQYRDAYADALSDIRKLALARGEEPHEAATP